jgi:regulatory protein
MRKGRSTETDEAEREPKRARHWREIEPLVEEGKTADPERIRKRGSQRKRVSLRPRQRAENPDEAPLKEEPARERVMKRAIRLLAARPRSEGELRERLLEKEWASAEAVEEAIEKLREYGYVEDERFALDYASYRVKRKPVGKRRLLRELAAQKVAEETARAAIEAVFAENPEEELLDRAIERRIARTGLPRSRAELKKLYDHLLRAGFQHELIMNRLRGFTLDQPED